MSVFGPENRMRTFRFYAHHGARPGMVWLVKTAVWAAAVLVSWMALGLAWWMSWRRWSRGGKT